MMESAVEIINSEARAGTWLISQGFDRPHKRIINNIENYKIQFLDLENNKYFPKGLIKRKIPANKAGRPVVEYILNEAQTIFLGTLFRTSAKKPDDPVLRFKVKLAKDFVKLKQTLANVAAQQHQPEWVEKRQRGKIARLDETNAIKAFVEYCTNNGSNNAKNYYPLLTKMVNTTMYEFEGNFKNIRDVMTAQQLDDTYFHDNVVRRALREGMAAGMDYHDIYQMVKDRIMALAEMLGKTEIVSKQLSMFQI